jgi:endonuclease-3
MDELVSCILSQHSSDVNSFPAFTRLKEAFPDWDDVVLAGPEQLANVIRKAGLANQKAKNIVSCLRMVHEETGEYSLEFLRRVSTMDARRWLMSLPGVGPKTASIVLCFSMGRETVPVDTHIYRVCWRLGLFPQTLGEAKSHDFLINRVPKDLAFRFHVDLIQHGRVICQALMPACEVCPVSDSCWWFKRGGPDQLRMELVEKRKLATLKRKLKSG